MSKQRLLGVVVLVLALVGGAFLLMRGGAEGEAGEHAADAQAARKQLIENKRAARARGEIDLSPCSASGMVVRASDKAPVAGALMLLTPKGFDEGRSLEPGQPADPITTRTDAGGRWKLPMVAPGRYTLSASAEGYLAGTRLDVVLKAGQASSGLDMELVEGGYLLSGAISDIGGGPIDGVLLQIVRTDAVNPLSFQRAPVSAKSDEDGRYRATLAEGDYAIITFHADYVADTRITSLRDGPRVEDFVLTPGAVIEGRVVARDTGTGVGDALVTFTNSRGALATVGGGLTIGGFGEGRVLTDGEGRFRLRGLQSGVVRLQVVAAGYATREAVDVPIGVAEQVSGVEILVDRAFKISGFVVSKQAPEQGLEGVLVGAFSLQPPALFVARGASEPDGYFEVLGVPPGGYTVGAIGEEALPNIFGTGATVTDADVTDVLVEMDTGATVGGRVEPAMAATIKASVDTDDMSMADILGAIGNQFASARADAEHGAFALRPITPGKLKLVATADTGERGEIDVEVPAEGLTDVVIRLEPRARVSGRVTDGAGKALADINVEFAPRKGGMMQLGIGGMQQGQFPAGEDGTYVARGLDPGTFDVRVKDRKGRVLGWAEPENPDEPTKPVTMTIEGSEERNGFDLVVEVRDGKIRGTVVGGDGAPVHDAWVTAVRDQGMSDMLGQTGSEDDENVVKAKTRKRSKKDDNEEADGDPRGTDIPMFFAETPVLTDEAGSFVVEKLRSGTYTLVAEGMKGSARARADDVEPGDFVRLELELLAGIAGKVTQGGKPVAEYRVEVKGPSKRGKTVRNDDGTFVIDRIDPGDYEIRVMAKDGSGEAEVTVKQNQTSNVSVALAGFGKIRGRLVNAKTGDPIAGAWMTVFNKEGGGSFDPSIVMSMFTGIGPRTGKDGQFEVGEIRPGKNEVSFMDRDVAVGGAQIASQEFTIEPEQDLDLGTIQGLPASAIPSDERGDLGMATRATTFDDRPLAPDGPDDDDDDKETGDETLRLWVFSITKGGPADEAGIEPGDEIVSIEGKGVAGMGARTGRHMLSSARLRIGQTLSLELDRAGSRQTVLVEATSKDKNEDEKQG